MQQAVILTDVSVQDRQVVIKHRQGINITGFITTQKSAVLIYFQEEN
jgi:hypothetical protein